MVIRARGRPGTGMEAIGVIRRGSAVAAVLVAALLILLPAAAMADWTPAGTPVTESRHPLRGYDLKRIDGIPYVAWSESNGHNYVIQVARLAPDSGKWVSVGPGPVNLDGTKDAFQPSLAAGPDGSPWLAWTERTGTASTRSAPLT